MTKLAVIYTIKPNPDKELPAKVMLQQELKAHGIVQKHTEVLADGTEESVWGYDEIKVYETGK